MLFKLEHGKTYSAHLTLSGFQAWGSNEQVAQYFAGMGFSDIKVSGSGSSRFCEGTWNGSSETIQLPDQVSDVKVLDEKKPPVAKAADEKKTEPSHEDKHRDPEQNENADDESEYDDRYYDGDESW